MTGKKLTLRLSSNGVSVGWQRSVKCVTSGRYADTEGTLAQWLFCRLTWRCCTDLVGRHHPFRAQADVYRWRGGLFQVDEERI